MTEPFELTATKALELIDKNKLSYLEWIESLVTRNSMIGTGLPEMPK